MLRKLGHGGAALFRERVARRHDGEQAIDEQHLARQRAIARREAADAEIHLPALHQGGDRRGDAILHANGDAGIRLRQLLDGLRHQRGGHRRQRRHGHQAAPMFPQLLRAGGNRLDVDQNALEGHQQLAAGLRQRHVPLVAIEQPHAHGALELLNLYGQGRLRHVQLGGGACEAACTGEHEKGADVAEIVNHPYYLN